MNKRTTEFGNLCRSYSAKLGLNMADIAKKFEKTQSTITKIEQGNLPVPYEFITKSMNLYEIEDKSEKMKFLLSYLNSSEKFEIPITQLGSLRKECLAALLIYGDVKERNPTGWGELLKCVSEFSDILNSKNPGFNTLSKEDKPL
jgi:transcriptional regulator with XRE-family HTH domain